jgi:hypothetical protein
MTDKRITGEANEHATLKFLHRFGWLTARMVAALQWHDATQGDAMARRTLRRLLDAKLVLKRQANGNDLWMLSAAGARLLREQYDLDATSGQSLKLAQTTHRACSNWFLISKLAEGFGIWTDGKTADGLLDSGGQGLIWLEVENAWKNRARRQEIETLCRRYLAHENGLMTTLDGGHHLARLAVVSTNTDALRLMHQTFTEAYDASLLSDVHLSNVEFTLLPVSASLAPGEGWTRHLWADLMMPG